MSLVDDTYLMNANYPCCGQSGRFATSGQREDFDDWLGGTISYQRHCSECGRKWEIVTVNTELDVERFARGRSVKKLVWTMTKGPRLVTDGDTLKRARSGKRKK